jgi:hypothetical protein
MMSCDPQTQVVNSLSIKTITLTVNSFISYQAWFIILLQPGEKGNPIRGHETLGGCNDVKRIQSWFVVLLHSRERKKHIRGRETLGGCDTVERGQLQQQCTVIQKPRVCSCHMLYIVSVQNPVCQQ